MEERQRSPTSSPLASIEDIQQRLVRPSLSVSYPEDHQGYNCRPLEVNPTQSKKKIGERKIDGTKKKKKLEDFLDPALLSMVCAKIGHPKKKTDGKKLKRDVRDDIDWPVDKLKPFMAESAAVEKPNFDAVGSLVHLRFQRDLEVSEENGACCTPFKLFEKTALKRFRG